MALAPSQSARARVGWEVRADTTHLVGGPLIRYGGKGRNAHLLVPHFARARLYVEPFFGAGSIFFKIPPGAYEREVVNDLDASLVTFFRVLRDRTDDLVRACELTPYSRTEFAAALEHSDDELEEARRVWVRSRQGFAGKARTVGDWGRKSGATGGEWLPGATISKLAALREFASRLAAVQIDCVDGVECIEKWEAKSCRDSFIYCDPPYVHATRTLNRDYEHEMDDAAHERLWHACGQAVGQGARVAISGYRCEQYDYWGHGWRRLEFDVALYGAREAEGIRRTECLWMSYPESEELSYAGSQPSLFDTAVSR